MGTSLLKDMPGYDEWLSTPDSRRGGRMPRVIALSLGVLTVIMGTFAGISVDALWSNGAHATPGQFRQAPATALPVTAPDARWSALTGERQATGAVFASYYMARQGSTSLGSALTPAIPVSGGWLQIFASGALFTPGNARGPRHLSLDSIGDEPTTPNSTSQLIHAGIADDASNILRLPLLRALMAAGSEVSIGGSISSLTYVDLRRAAQPDHLIPAPAWYSAANPTGSAGTFIPEGRQSGKITGHLIPSAFWNALARPDLAPDGWQTDYGQPLTEALPALATDGGQTRALTVQIFERGGLVLDATGSPGHPDALPTVHPLNVGLDYLRTFGPPDVAIASDTPVWVTADTALHATADGSSATLAHVGRNFPLVLTAEAVWVGTTLWYQASWHAAHRLGIGWVPARAVTFGPVSDAPATAGFDALEPDLDEYLSSFGSRVGAVVYDVSGHTYYQYNERTSFIVASSVKVPIMLALLAQLEAQGREPNADEMALLTTMIENSNNDSAQLLYEEIGDAPGLGAFMQRVGVPGLDPTAGAWGWSTITPLAMVRLLALLQSGTILTARHRALALNLMRHIESDEQTGVGSTAPAGATVAMKDGWVPGPDGRWVMNTSGIVTVGQETYIISVYTQHDDSLEQGWTITQHVSRQVAQLLI